MKVLDVIFGMAILVGDAWVTAYFTDSDFRTIFTFVVAVELLLHEKNGERHEGKPIKTDEEDGGGES